MLKDLDRLCGESRDVNLPPAQLVELHTHIAGLRYSLTDSMVRAEKRHSTSKDLYETHCIKTRLMMQTQNDKLSTAKATDIVEGEESTQLMRLDIIEKQAEYQHIRQRLSVSNDILISISIRIKMFKQEQIDGLQEYNHG